MFMPSSYGTKDSDYSIYDSPEPDLKTLSISLHHTTHHTDYSISDSPEPDLKTLSIPLHRYYTLYLLVVKIQVHVTDLIRC
jgi:hypothetical protein